MRPFRRPPGPGAIDRTVPTDVVEVLTSPGVCEPRADARVGSRGRRGYSTVGSRRRRPGGWSCAGRRGSRAASSPCSPAGRCSWCSRRRLLAGCSAPLKPQTAADRTSPPELGACYVLTPKDTDAPSNATATVPCTQPHTSETFAIGDAARPRPARSTPPRPTGSWIYPTCERAFEKFIGVDESLAMRVKLSWAWFRPSQRGWDKGARWYRCDLVGGTEEASALHPAAHDRPGAVPGQAARGVAAVRPGPQRAGLRRRSPAPRRTTGARSPRSSSAARATPTPATGWCRCAHATSAPTRSGRG